MTLHVDAFLATLPILVKGMGGIFLVTAVIVLLIAALNRFTSKQTGKEK